jgi:hypothetical protein
MSLPDLTFDFLPSVSWTTPVTPPNHCNDAPPRKNMHMSATNTNLEDLLFDDKFEIDFGSMENIGHLEFDADLDAILQQHL